MGPRESRCDGSTILSTVPYCHLWAGSVAARSVGVFALPLHCGVDADIAAGVVEEEEFLDGAGFEFSVLAELEIDLSSPVGLTCSVEAIHIGLILQGAGDGVEDGS